MKQAYYEYDFFISYNHKDLVVAEWITWQLEEAGYKALFQAWDFKPGNNFVLEMQKGAVCARTTLALLSQHYLDSLFTQPEWAAAFGGDPTGTIRKFIPVRIDDIYLEGLLPQIIYIDLVDKESEEAKLTLLKGVREERAKPISPPAFPGKIQKKNNDVTDLISTTVNWEQNWIKPRLEILSNNTQQVKLSEGTKYCIHLIPIEAISSPKKYDLALFEKQTLNLKPLYSNSWDYRFNKDGFYTFAKWPGEEMPHSYTQIFRNAILEAVDTGVLNGSPMKYIPGVKFEQEILQYIERYLKVYKELELKMPVAISISLINIKDYFISLRPPEHNGNIQDELLTLPVAYLTSWDEELDKVLKSSFDYLWNNCGVSNSPNYDQNGKWKPRSL